MNLYYAEFLRFTLASVFAVAVVGKVRSKAAWQDFVTSAAQLTGSPARLGRPIAALTAIAEALAVFLLLVPGTTKAGLVLTATLLLAFTASAVAVLVRRTRVACRCFGSARPISLTTLFRNGLLLAFAAGAWTGQTAAHQMPFSNTTVVAATAIAVALLVAFAEELIDIFVPAQEGDLLP